ncbi:MAG: murein biosynthesis integral membrane protein MurJ [Phycisphaerae bacterium]|nr:murein biosynthesis integral membrane protein MurJ [Phycisphaerae bacterium]
MDGEAHREREHFFSGAKTIASVTLLSRIFGLVRDMAITQIGATRVTDAFALASKVPNLFRRLFGEGALSAAFVPVFTETVETHGVDRGRVLLANALGLLTIFLAGLLVLAGAGLAVWGLVFPGNWDRQLVLGLLGVMLPFTLTVCLLALGSAALNCRGHFAYPAFAPILLNVFMIAAAVLAPRVLAGNVPGQLYLIAASVSVAGVVQLAGALWVLRRAGFSVRPVLRPVQPGIATMLKTMLPMVLGLGFLQLSEVLNDLIAWTLTATAHSPTLTLLGHEIRKPLGEGVLMRVYAAQRLYQFPMGVLAVSLGVAIFPLLSRYAARGDMASFRESLNRALRVAMMEGLAAGTGLFVLAEPIVRVLFRRRHFTSADAATTAFVLQMYVLGMWAYCTYQMFVRAFYSLKDTLTPMKTGCALVVPNMVLFAGLVWVGPLGPGAFGVATAVTFAANTCILAALFRRRLGRFGGRKLAVSVLRSLAACAVMCAVIWPIRSALSGRSDLLIVGLCVPAGVVAFVGAVWLLRAPELGELLGAVRGRGAAGHSAKRNDGPV